MRAPWRERNGSFSWYRAAFLLAVCAPGIATAVQYYAGFFPVRPITEIIHATGLWTIRLLMISLAVTPFRQSFRWARLVTVRRMIGVAAFSYAVLHITFYAADNMFDLPKVVSEIALRIYLTIGFAALLILGALALTSTDGMVKRLGGKAWQRLHRWIYLAGVLACIHYFMQSKLNVSEPLVVAGLFLWMMMYRLVFWLGSSARAAALPTLAGLGVAASLATGFGEAAYYHFRTNAPFLRVLEANLNFHAGSRPAWVVLGITMAIVLVAALRQWQHGRQATLASA
ncbi:protein-methionine-sulfoxide reductase heme-binding subunit MsrQ [Dongia sedimenti]|uniref:Protein-methionine-sulfoxide reductase heme-binding subunit MsrQ n=1 Tax=Dongia sedimenti TaxID=3064282 RepID=A0ABU0YGI4_9PROT|nr:protein-methionine-sulfoxide reductase heme-binding subunit MsrQ [Rhodospirillaceae bacterium R-7]